MNARGPRAGVGPGTRAAHAGLPVPGRLDAFLPGPALQSAVHLPGEADPAGYGRFANPTWSHYEAALGELDGGEATVFASGAAAVSAAVSVLLRDGGTIVAPADGYPVVRTIAGELARRGDVRTRFVASDEAAIRAALPGAAVVWIETPSNPELRVLDIAALAEAAHAAGARLVVDNSLATPYLQRPLELGADVAVASATKALSGHADLLLGYVATRDDGLVAHLRSWRTTHGAIPGPFETWLAHRSLATLGVRMDRQQATSAALAELLRARDDVAGVRHPGLGGVLAFELASAERADAFLAACALVRTATSFGGVHASAERRARWGTDAVAPGFVRFSCGVEDTADVLADVTQALDATAP